MSLLSFPHSSYTTFIPFAYHTYKTLPYPLKNKQTKANFLWLSPCLPTSWRQNLHSATSTSSARFDCPPPSWNNENTLFWYFSCFLGGCVLLWLLFLFSPGSPCCTTAAGTISSSEELCSAQPIQPQGTVLALFYNFLSLTVELSRVLAYVAFSHSTSASWEISFPLFHLNNAHSYPSDSQNCIFLPPKLTIFLSPYPLHQDTQVKLNKFSQFFRFYPPFCHLFSLSALLIQLTNQNIHHPFLLHKWKTHRSFLLQTCILLFFTHALALQLEWGTQLCCLMLQLLPQKLLLHNASLHLIYRIHSRNWNAEFSVDNTVLVH